MENERKFIEIMKKLGYDEIEIDEIEFDCCLTAQDKERIAKTESIPSDLRKSFRTHDIVRYLAEETRRLKSISPR